MTDMLLKFIVSKSNYESYVLMILKIFFLTLVDKILFKLFHVNVPFLYPWTFSGVTEIEYWCEILHSTHLAISCSMSTSKTLA